MDRMHVSTTPQHLEVARGWLLVSRKHPRDLEVKAKEKKKQAANTEVALASLQIIVGMTVEVASGLDECRCLASKLSLWSIGYPWSCICAMVSNILSAS